MDNYHHNLLFVIATATIIILFVTTHKASSYNNSISRDYFYHVGPIADPNDPMHVKAQRQFGNYDYSYTQSCDKAVTIHYVTI